MMLKDAYKNKPNIQQFKQLIYNTFTSINVATQTDSSIATQEDQILIMSDIDNAFNILQDALITYDKDPDKWDTIVNIINELPGNNQEKAIFFMGYMFHIIVNDYNNQRN